MTAGVYLIRAENGLTKIGYSSCVESRLGLLQTGSPVGLTVLHVIETDRYKETERALHDLFADQRRRGEWFELSEADVTTAKGYTMPRKPRAPRPAKTPPPAPSEPEPPKPTLSTEQEVACQRFGRAMRTACEQADYYQAQGQTAEAERWQMIVDRLFEDAKRWVESGSAAGIAQSAEPER